MLQPSAKKKEEAGQSRPPRKKVRAGNAEAGPSSGPVALDPQAGPLDQHTHFSVSSDTNPIPDYSVPQFMDEPEKETNELNGENTELLHLEGPESYLSGIRARVIDEANTEPQERFNLVQCQCADRATVHLSARYFLKIYSKS